MCKYELYKDINIRNENNLRFRKDNSLIINCDNNKLNGTYTNESKAIYVYMYGLNEITKAKENQNIVLDGNYDYKVEFIGSKDENISLFLYVLTYDEDDNKIYGENLKINSTKVIKSIEKGKYIKLAIRIANKGKFVVDSIKIYRTKKINSILNNEVNKITIPIKRSIDSLKIACIFDSFTMSCFESLCTLIKIKTNTWRYQLQQEKPDFLMVESAWHGNDDNWVKKVQYINENSIEDLKEVIKWCNKNNIPTVFWNKEDPVHYENFIETTKLFDYVFTTDEKSIDRYKNDVKHNNVYTLLFAAQPKIHNPIKICEKRIEKACFAGSFYNHKYPKRKERLIKLLRLAIKYSGLDIYDRNYNLSNPQYKYPDEFKEYISGNLATQELQTSNKGYKIMLNVNTITNSPTMFSRRVFEGLACGTPVISTYSYGVKNIFEDLVVCSDDENELAKEFAKLKDIKYYEEKSIKGIRQVLSNHTYKDRLLYILEKIGINVENDRIKVALVSMVSTIEELERVKNIYENQEYEYKNLYLITNSIQVYNRCKDKIKNLILINGKMTLETISFNEDYISIINHKNHYGEYYIRDLINATLYCDAEFIGKKSYFRYDCKIKQKSNEKEEIIINNKSKEYEYVDSLYLDRSILNSKIINNCTLNELVEIINTNSVDKFKFGIRYFSVDKFNFIEDIVNSNYDTKFCDI